MHAKVTSHKHVQSVLEVQWNDVVFSTFGPWMHRNVALIACLGEIEKLSRKSGQVNQYLDREPISGQEGEYLDKRTNMWTEVLHPTKSGIPFGFRCILHPANTRLKVSKPYMDSILNLSIRPFVISQV